MKVDARSRSRLPLTGWHAEIRDFWQFVRHPNLRGRFPRTPMGPLATDWLGGLSVGRILRWVGLLWAVNFLVLGPVAAGAAARSGAEHHFDVQFIPWMLALLWAPLVEELMFRLGMRRFGAALWLLPGFLALAWWGRDWVVVTFLALSLAAVACPRPVRHGGWLHSAQPLLPGVRWSWRWNRRYRLAFPWVFHALSAGFALLHLFNFQLTAVAWWLWPLLVLPQWVTGLVLGWLRVRGGMVLAMLTHAGFNAGPLLLLLMFKQLGGMSGA